MRKVIRRIGKDAKIRATSYIDNDLCARCMFLGDDCNGVTITANKLFDNQDDIGYTKSIIGCNSFIEEYLTNAELESTAAKPCPFCKGVPQHKKSKNSGKHYISCLNCSVCGGWARTKELAIRNWNLRGN